MAELTNLESKLGEVIGLAMAAQAAAQTVTKLAQGEKERGVIEMLKVMKAEAKEAEQRGKSVAETFDGKKSAILKEARETKQKAAQMMDTYLDQESDTLDGLEFMTMAEAGEVGHWEILARFNKRARNAEVKDLVSWGFPIQKRHLTEVRASSLQLVDKEDPEGSS
jgi:predicted nucleic acid-binding protein